MLNRLREFNERLQEAISILLIVLVTIFVLGLLLATYASARPAQASVYWEDYYICTGQRFNPDGITAAHRTLPLGTKLTISYRPSRRVIVVEINDRGPAEWTHREIDLSRGAAKALRFPGTGRVDVQPWPPLPKPRPQYEKAASVSTDGPTQHP